MEGVPVRYRLALLLAYDGQGWYGLARQRGLPTVQGAVEDALSRLLGVPVLTVAAGRTDAGVHARHQVLHADLAAPLGLPGLAATLGVRLRRARVTAPAAATADDRGDGGRGQDEAAAGVAALDRVVLERLGRALTGMLAPRITLRGIAWAAPAFDARFSARTRTYRYRIDDSGCPDPLLRGWVLAWARPLDVGRMRAAATYFCGSHDFASFCRHREGASTRRRLGELVVERMEALIVVRATADSFCHQMVRAIVGHLIEVGEHRRAPEDVVHTLKRANRDGVGRVAPPHGLVLEDVGYPLDVIPRWLAPEPAWRSGGRLSLGGGVR